MTVLQTAPSGRPILVKKHRSRSHMGKRQYAIGDAIGQGVTRPLPTIRCAWCKTPLCDAAGDPRWDIRFPLTFVCQGGCR